MNLPRSARKTAQEIEWDRESGLVAQGWAYDVLACAYREDVEISCGQEGRHSIADLMEMHDDPMDRKESCVLADRMTRWLARAFMDFYDDSPVMPEEEVASIGRSMLSGNIPEERWLEIVPVYMKIPDGSGFSRKLRLVRVFSPNGADIFLPPEADMPDHVIPVSREALLKFDAEEPGTLISRAIASEDPAKGLSAFLHSISLCMRGENPGTNDGFSKCMSALASNENGLSARDRAVICQSLGRYVKSLVKRAEASA